MDEINNVNNTSAVNDSNKSVKVFWLMIIFAVMVCGVLSFFINDSWKSKENNELPQAPNTNNNTRTVEQTKSDLERQISFSVPSINKSTEAVLGDLNNDISSFVVSEAVSLDIKREMYSNNTKGWTITYNLPVNVYKAYYRLIKVSESSPFTILSASRTEIAAIIGTESPKYKVKVVVENLDKDLSKLTINIQEKN